MQYYPPCLCVHTCVPSRSGKYLSLESLQEGFRYLKQNGLSLAGDIVTQVACMTKPEEEYFNWHIVWFLQRSIRKKKKFGNRKRKR